MTSRDDRVPLSELTSDELLSLAELARSVATAPVRPAAIADLEIVEEFDERVGRTVTIGRPRRRGGS